jgi:hypothetical protein
MDISGANEEMMILRLTRYISILKGSMVRHPGRWLLGMCVLGVAFTLLGLYFAGYRRGVKDTAGEQTVIKTIDGREYDLYIPPKIGFTFRPFISVMYMDTTRAGFGVEGGRVSPLNFDLLVSVPVLQEVEKDKIAFGGGVSHDINLNWRMGGTIQWRLDDEWIGGVYWGWRF